MTSFVPDTNIWIHIGKDADLTSKFEKTLGTGDKFLIAPPALIEVVRGMVRYGKEMFSEDRKTFIWMLTHKCEILDLTRPFMAKVLKTNLPKNSGVLPAHYAQLIEMVVNSSKFDEFVQQCNADDSVWKNIESLDQIHEGQVETELRALEDLARQGRALDIPKRLASTFGAPGCRPIPIVISRQFSAAIEYLDSVVRKVAHGSKPRKNDRGLYVDWQLLMYLAHADINFLTNEDFSGEISKSPQIVRIVKPDALV
jgi:hypothetical protein